MQEKPNYWAVIPADVLHSDKLTDSEKILFAHITTLQQKSGICHASDNYLAKVTGASKSSIQRRLKKLESLFLIVREVIYEDDGKTIKTRNMRLGILRNGHTPIPTADTTPMPTADRENNTSNNNINTIDQIDEFGRFWSLYGKKTGKDKCFKKWCKLKKSEKDEIFKVLPEYIKSTPDKQYRKNPLTWLNGKHWEDEISTAPDEVESEWGF